MADELKDVIMYNARREVLINLLKKGTRFDNRKFDEYRKIEIQKNVIKSAEGSALATIGSTKVLVGIKFDILTPFPDRPKEGVFITNCELLPLASASFEPGPPDENSIELARVVDRGIRSAECVDLNSFFIEDGKVLALFLDIYVLDHAGNYTDAASCAALSALTCTKVPKLEGGKIIRGEYSGNLKLTSHPVSTSSIKTGDYWLVDPIRDEELASETKLTISTTEDHVCAIQKGKGFITKDELMTSVDLAFKSGSDIRKIVKE